MRFVNYTLFVYLENTKIPIKKSRNFYGAFVFFYIYDLIIILQNMLEIKEYLNIPDNPLSFTLYNTQYKIYTICLNLFKNIKRQVLVHSYI